MTDHNRVLTWLEADGKLGASPPSCGALPEAEAPLNLGPTRRSFFISTAPSGQARRRPEGVHGAGPFIISIPISIPAPPGVPHSFALLGPRRRPSVYLPSIG